MLLDRLDIDSHGPLNRVELGPFSEHLNVICGPEGAGKTAIARFIRDSLTNRHYPLGMMSSSAGRVVWADHNGIVHCRREQDGTPTGRRSVEFESRGEFRNDYSQHRHSWISAIASRNDATNAAQSLNLPESIVDGVITDSAVTSVARVVSACVRSGLDNPAVFANLPIPTDRSYLNGDSRTAGAVGYEHRDRQDDGRRELRAQLADVESELTRLKTTSINRVELLQRRNELAARLASAESVPQAATNPAWEIRLEELYEQTRRLRVERSELRRWIAELDSDLARRRNHHGVRETYSDYAAQAAAMDADLRRRLDDLDAQMIRWRRALMEVRGLRSAILAGRRSQNASQEVFVSEMDHATARRRRLDGFLKAVDRYAPGSNWDDFYGDATRGNHFVDDIESRIESATRQIDWLLDRYAKGDNLQSDWFQSLPNYAAAQQSRSNTTLAETLRTIRDDLRYVHTRARQSSNYAAFNSGAAAADQNEIEELTRSERWLTAAIDQLMDHRETLLRGFPTQDNNQNADWTFARYERERAERVAELQRVDSQLQRSVVEASDIRRSMRDVPQDKQWIATENLSTRDAIAEEIRRIDEQLASSTRLQWLENRRAELLRQLGAVRNRTHSESPLAEEASRWLVRLSAGRLTRIDWPYAAFRETRATHGHYGSEVTGETHVRINGQDETHCSAADRALASMAVRMAAGELLARTGRSIPLVFETHRELLQYTTAASFAPAAYESDWLSGASTAQAAYRDHSFDGRSNHPIAAALHDYTRSGHQVIVLTSSHELSLQLQRVGGSAFNLHAERIVHPHRPLWKPHYASEKYVGPHAHTYGSKLAPDYRAVDHGFVDQSHQDFSHRDYGTVDFTPAAYGANDYHRSGFPHYSSVTPTASASVYRGADVDPVVSPRIYPRNASTLDINRNFDTAWREAYGVYDNPERFNNHELPQTDWATDGIAFRDGYYFADSYTTVPDPRHDVLGRANLGGRASWAHPTLVAGGVHVPGSVHGSHLHGVHPTLINPGSMIISAGPQFAADARIRKLKTPFFLTVDSSIDQAPSIDAVAAARLRGLNVTHINHLMQQDPNRLADSLGLANVDADTIRHWQSECRLVCRVPQLRGFDARILVGCGIIDPAQLSAIHPNDLLDRVEAFLATERGQRILMSGSSYELSRITSWIAAANSSDSDRPRYEFEDNRVVNGRVIRGGRRQYTHDQYIHDSDRYEYDYDGNGDYGTANRRRRKRIRTVASGPTQIPTDINHVYDNGTGYGGPTGYTNGSRSNRNASTRRARDLSEGPRYGITPDGYGAGSGSGTGNGTGRSSRSGRSRSRSNTGTSNTGSGQSRSGRNGNGNGAGQGYGYGQGQGSGYGNGSGRGNGSGNGNGSGRGYGSGSGNGSGQGYGSGRSNRSGQGKSNRGSRDVVRMQNEHEPREYVRGERESREYEPRQQRERSERESYRSERRERSEREPRKERESRSRDTELRFYLQRDSPIVDAPSIGTRMAERFEAIGIHTVDDLLKANPETLAEQLDHRRIDAAVIKTYQQQATLVCRIPMLRGHDAQLLVAAEVTTPEEVATYDPNDLLALIIPIAKSSQGKRILRGGKMPDLEEMNDWINYAGQNRELVAA